MEAGRIRSSSLASVLICISAALLIGACTPQDPATGGGTKLAPLAVVSVGATAGPAPFSAAFSAIGSADPDGSITSYSWDLGDGTSSDEANPTKSYNAPGTYFVKLTVTDNDGLTAASQRLAVTAYAPGDASGLVYFPMVSRSLALRTDKIAVWTCKVSGTTGPVHDPAAVAAWAQREADAYFDVVSRGQYHTEFIPAGTFEISPAVYTQEDCLNAAIARTDAPYTNVMAVDTSSIGGGLGTVGSTRWDGTSVADTEPPSRSLRGFMLGGPSFLDYPHPPSLLHEIGHTLGFPHSYLNPSYEYDNFMDLMSAQPESYECRGSSGLFYSCHPNHTIAFNRWAAGWIPANLVLVHNGGTDHVVLSGPETTNGTQLVVAPSTTSSQALVTIEARPNVGIDELLPGGGVAVHVVDQRASACTVGAFSGCPGLWRRQGQAAGVPYSYEHVVPAGATKTIRGLTVAVGQRTSGGYDVTVSGRASVPEGTLQVRSSAQMRREPGSAEDSGTSGDSDPGSDSATGGGSDTVVYNPPQP